MTNSSTYPFPFENLPLRNQKLVEGGTSALHFAHPKVNNGKALVIKTGADSVKWGYSLNVRRIPTYGGEVIQILSMFAQQMSVSGKTRNYKEQAEIYDYFREYLKVAGGFGNTATSFDRVSTPITFSYPARGWSFDIIVTDLKDMRMALDVVTPEWGFTAEIVSENDRYELGNAILTGMQAVLNSDLIHNTNTKTGVIGYDPSNPFSAPTSVDGKQLGTDINERLQQQIGSWATGDFTDYLFQTAVGQAQDIGFKNAADYYQSKFGSDVAFAVGGGGNGTGTNTTEGNLRGLSGTLTGVQIAALASQGFKNKGYNDAAKDRDKLIIAVRVAYGESNWVTRAINHNGSGPPANPVSYDTYISKYVNKQPPDLNRAQDESFDLGLWQINTIHQTSQDKQGRKVKDNHALLLDDPLYNAEIMATISQGGTKWHTRDGGWVSYDDPASSANSTEIINRSKDAVDKFLLNPDNYLGSVGPPDVNGTVRQKVLQYARYLMANEPLVHYADPDGPKSNLRLTYDTPPPPWPIWTDCSACIILMYRWAGAGSNGAGWSSGNTESMKSSLTKITKSDAGPGDIIVYDQQGTTSAHAVMILTKKGDGNFTAFSHGTESGPDEEDAPPAGRTVHYLRWPGVA